MKIGVFVGSIRQGALGCQVGDWIMEETSRLDLSGVNGGEPVEFVRIDLRSFELPHFDGEAAPFSLNKKYSNAKVTRFSQAVDECDGYIFVSPEYNHSVPGTMKNAVDHLGKEWSNKAIGYVSYGPMGGTRAVEHWRVIMANFYAQSVRDQVALSMSEDMADGGLSPRNTQVTTLDRMLQAVVGLSRAMAPMRDE